MPYRSVVATMLAVLIAMLPSLAVADTVTLPNGNPAFYDTGHQLIASGVLRGLTPHQDAVVRLDASASNETYCLDPSTGNFVDGEPSVAIVRGVQTIPGGAITPGGSVSFGVVTAQAATMPAVAVGCPNATDIVYSADLAFRQAVISVRQPAGVTVFTVDCAFSPPVLFGPIADAYMSCVTAQGPIVDETNPPNP